MLTRLTSRFFFSSPKEEYGRFFVLRFFFPRDGYYESNEYRPAFIQHLKSLQDNKEAIVLGGDSFPFGCTTLYINCDQEETVNSFAKKNVFVSKGLAECQVSEIQRLSSSKFGNVANFYQMKLQL